MELDELWAALSGTSGAALVGCLVVAAVALRWSGRRPARRAVARAHQKQHAALETMDKAAQHFRLQVTAGHGVRWGVGTPTALSAALERRGAGGGLRGWQAAQVCGQQRFNSGNPSCS